MSVANSLYVDRPRDILGEPSARSSAYATLQPTYILSATKPHIIKQVGRYQIKSYSAAESSEVSSAAAFAAAAAAVAFFFASTLACFFATWLARDSGPFLNSATK